jgi:geranylgeranyl diphosphate synthase type I
LSENELAAVADLVAEAGGRSWAEAAARRQLSEALSCLSAVHPRPEAESDLTAIAHLIVRRDR